MLGFAPRRSERIFYCTLQLVVHSEDLWKTHSCRACCLGDDGIGAERSTSDKSVRGFRFYTVFHRFEDENNATGSRHASIEQYAAHLAHTGQQLANMLPRIFVSVRQALAIFLVFSVKGAPIHYAPVRALHNEEASPIFAPSSRRFSVVSSSRSSSGSGTALAETETPAPLLRVCNAYGLRPSLSVLGETIPFRSCSEQSAGALGKSIDVFSSADELVLLGTFRVETAVDPSSVLLLVVQPADSWQGGVAFQSHLFSPPGDPQIAVLDGGAASTSVVRVRHAAAEHEDAAEELRMGSVTTVNPGAYEVALASMEESAAGGSERTSRLVSPWRGLNAQQSGRYSVVRVEDCAGRGAGHVCEADLLVFPSFGLRRVEGASGAIIVSVLVGFFVSAFSFL